MPTSESPTLNRSRQSPAHSGGGSTPSRYSRNRPPHSAPKSRGPGLAAPRAGGGSHHRAAPPPIGQTWGIRGAQPPPHQTPGPGRNAPAFLAAAPVSNATRITRHAGYATGCAVPARESPLPAAPRNRLGKDLHQCAPRSSRGCHHPWWVRYHSTVRRSPSCTLTCGVQPSSASILLASIA